MTLALVFLHLHGIEVRDRNDELYELVMAIARSETTKDEVTLQLRDQLLKPRPSC